MLLLGENPRQMIADKKGKISEALTVYAQRSLGKPCPVQQIKAANPFPVSILLPVLPSGVRRKLRPDRHDKNADPQNKDKGCIGQRLAHRQQPVFVSFFPDPFSSGYRNHRSQQHPQRKIKQRRTDTLTKAGFELFEVLRAVRLQLARAEGMPPYIIFSDKTLIDMCIKLPRSRESMLDVSGVGQTKYDKYGEQFIGAIDSFMSSNPDAVTSISEEE